MDSSNIRLKYLFERYRSGAATTPEKKELMQLIASDSGEEPVKELLDEELELLDEMPVEKRLDPEKAKQIFDRIVGRDKKVPVRKMSLWWAAAAIFILFGAGAGYFLMNHKPAEPAGTHSLATSIAPGGNKATLKLGNGSTIILDSAKNGMLVKQGNTTITKLNNGQLAYNALNEKPAAALFNTLSTPRGGQYQLSLPDGSKAWLNAASSITYPAAFTGNERHVDITGEVYFEVAKNPRLPFSVSTSNISVQVLGTHFNINAYADEPEIKTTLLEGSIKFVSGKSEKLLKPGEQAILNKNTMSVDVEQVDTEQAIAWKNGRFEFNNTGIAIIMRQIQRWYDVDVDFEANYPDIKLGGGISRNLNLSEVLALLEKNGVHTKMENRKIIVIP